MTIKEFNIGVLGIFGFALFSPISIAFSQICIGISLLGWILMMIRENSFQWKKTPLDIPILIYVFIQVISVLFSHDIPMAFNSWINTDWFILFYYAVVNQIDEEADYRKIFILLAISGSISAIYGIIQHFVGIDFIRGDRNIWPYGDFFRATGFFSLPLTYGGIQMAYFIVLAPFYFLKDEILNKKAFSIIMLLLLFSIIASYARSAWMGFGAALVLLIFFLKKKYKLIIIGAAIISFITIYFIHPNLLFKYGFFSMFDISANAPYNNLVRIKLWHSTWNMIKDNWLIGIGYSHYAEILEAYKVPFDYRGLTDPHNGYLKVAALSGIFGGIAFILIWVQDLRTKYSKYQKPQLLGNFTSWKAGSVGSIFAVFAFMTATLTQEYYHDAETAEIWWFIAALGMVGVLKKNKLD